MFKPFTQTVILIALIVLLSACGSAMTVLPPTDAAVSALTSTPALPPPSATSTSQPIILEKVAALDLPDSFVNTIVFSPDGQTMITGDLDGEALLWKRETWGKTTFLPARCTHAEATNIPYWGTLALSPDGNVIVQAYGDNGDVTGRDRAGKELFAFSYGARVYSVAISPDGKFLAVGGLKSDIVIFNLETRQPAADLPSDHESIQALVFSPDGKTLLAHYRLPDHIFTTWDVAIWQATDTFLHDVEPGRIGIHDVLFSLNGKELVIASTERVEIKILDFATKEIIKEFPEHSRCSYQIALSPDESLLASAGDDFTLRLWDMETGINFKTIRTSHETLAVAFSPDGDLIAFSVLGEGVQVWAITR